MNRYFSAALLLVCLGCPSKTPLDSAVGAPQTVFEAARARVVPNVLKAKFGIKLHSKPLGLAASTSGGLIVARPGKGRIDLFGPMGNSLVTASSDGVALSILLAGQERQLLAADAESVLRETTGGVAGLDDVFAVLVGDLPFDEARVRSLKTTPDPLFVGPATPEAPVPQLVCVELDGPKDTTVEAYLNADATPRSLIARDGRGDVVMTATYDPFALVGADWMPTRVELYMPALDLTVEAKYRSWETLTAVPDSIVPTVPAGFTSEPLETLLRGLAAAVGKKGG